MGSYRLNIFLHLLTDYKYLIIWEVLDKSKSINVANKNALTHLYRKGQTQLSVQHADQKMISSVWAGNFTRFSGNLFPKP